MIQKENLQEFYLSICFHVNLIFCDFILRFINLGEDKV